MKVSYQRMYNVGQYLNEKIGFEIEGEEICDASGKILSPIEAVKYLKQMCDEAHKEMNKHIGLSEERDGREWGAPPVKGFSFIESSPYPSTQKVNDDPPINPIESGINSCTELKVLESYRLLVKKDAKLQEVFDNKFKELSV